MQASSSCHGEETLLTWAGCMLYHLRASACVAAFAQFQLVVYHSVHTITSGEDEAGQQGQHPRPVAAGSFENDKQVILQGVLENNKLACILELLCGRQQAEQH